MASIVAHQQDTGVPTPSKFSKDQLLTALGEAIRLRRKECKLSQEALADKAQLDRSYLGQVERGENSIALHPLVRVAHALDTTASELLDQAGF